MTEHDDFMHFLFGKKKRRSSKTSKGKKKSCVGGTQGWQAKKCGKSYRVVKVCQGRKYTSGKPVNTKFPVRKYKADARKDLPLKTARRKSRSRSPSRRRRSSSFGTGPNFLPGSAYMSPYPYSVDGSTPWI
jgi:hypothetical protein